MQWGEVVMEMDNTKLGRIVNFETMHLKIYMVDINVCVYTFIYTYIICMCIISL